MPEQLLAKLVKKEKLKEDIYRFSVEAKTIVEKAKPGNFVEIRVGEGTEPFLRRPISIYNLEKENGLLQFIFQVKGKGTELLAKKEEGDFIDMIGPLGYGTFKIEGYERIAILGGGIGTFPLYELAKEAKEKGKVVDSYLGFRNKEAVVLEQEFKKVSDSLAITTDDGSYGLSGFAIDYLKKTQEKQPYDIICACGPLPMLKTLQSYVNKKQINCQISLEEKMGCGLGVCLGCAVKTAKSPKEAPEYFHVCKGGPVFNAKDVEI